MTTIVKMKAGDHIEAGNLVTFVDGKAYAINPKYIEVPVSKASRWFRIHILRKEPLLMENPNYIGPPSGICYTESDDENDVLVMTSGLVEVK